MGSAATAIHRNQEKRFSGPYSAVRQGSRPVLHHQGASVFTHGREVSEYKLTEDVLTNRLKTIVGDSRYSALHRIDNEIFFAAVRYFESINAEWCNLPLTTLMISSPGEVYAGNTLDYTTDTLPVRLDWFSSDRQIFLSESSQFYLELRLLLENIDKVFCIYNSFRKEKADATHLSEFQHIEFEGKVEFEENIQIAERLVRKIVESIIKKESNALAKFISPAEIDLLSEAVAPDQFERMTFKEALATLYQDTQDARYKTFSLKHFGSWEEVRLTEIVGKNVWVTEFPMMQIPFYHQFAKKDEDGVPLAENADLIMYGYRECLGAGRRISDPHALAEKAKTFNLPEEDYQPYLETRGFAHYRPTAGFGLGWQRIVQWMLKLPVIWEATHIPRSHFMPKP